MEYLLLFLVAGLIAFAGVRFSRKPVPTAPATAMEHKKSDPVGVGSLVSVPFAKRRVVGRVACLRGRRVKITALVRGHRQTVIRKLHQLRPART